MAAQREEGEEDHKRKTFLDASPFPQSLQKRRKYREPFPSTGSDNELEILLSASRPQAQDNLPSSSSSQSVFEQALGAFEAQPMHPSRAPSEALHSPLSSSSRRSGADWPLSFEYRPERMTSSSNRPFFSDPSEKRKKVRGLNDGEPEVEPMSQLDDENDDEGVDGVDGTADLEFAPFSSPHFQNPPEAVTHERWQASSMALLQQSHLARELAKFDSLVERHGNQSEEGDEHTLNDGQDSPEIESMHPSLSSQGILRSRSRPSSAPWHRHSLPLPTSGHLLEDDVFETPEEELQTRFQTNHISSDNTLTPTPPRMHQKISVVPLWIPREEDGCFTRSRRYVRLYSSPDGYFDSLRLSEFPFDASSSEKNSLFSSNHLLNSRNHQSMRTNNSNNTTISRNFSQNSYHQSSNNDRQPDEFHFNFDPHAVKPSLIRKNQSSF